jgi:hypothetical protein
MAVTPDQVYGDSRWLQAQPGFRNRFSQILLNTGIVPDQATLDQYGLGSLFDPSQSAAAANNPYSIAKLLQNRLSGTLTNNATTANARGGLFSGAFQNSQDQAGRDYQQAYSQAGSRELSDLLGIQGDQSNLYGSIWTDYANRPVAPDPTVYPPAPTITPGSAGVGGNTGIPVPQTPYYRTGPEAGGNVVKKKISSVVSGSAGRAL